MNNKWYTSLICVLFTFIPTVFSYLAQRNAPELSLNHARIARTLVHQTNWASVGSISRDKRILGYPMVNIISVDDNDVQGHSTGRIRFMLTDLDFTGADWHKNNNVTFLFSNAQTLNCRNANEDPMEPTCARVIIGGHIRKLDNSSAHYEEYVAAFEQRHPASTNWIKAHNFYLCELDIEIIYVVDFYGGPHIVSPEDYYNPDLKSWFTYEVLN